MPARRCLLIPPSPHRLALPPRAKARCRASCSPWTLATGIVDATAYLGLGHVFVANMTGNVMFLAFAVVGAPEFNVSSAATALAAFLFGALIGGRMGVALSPRRSRLLVRVMAVECGLLLAACICGFAVVDVASAEARQPIIALLGLALGAQTAMARRLGVDGLTTTVLTITLAGWAADCKLARGTNPDPGRRVGSTVTMFAGGAAGACLVLRFGARWHLAP